MATREEFLRQVWNDVINSPMKSTWIRNRIAASEKELNGPFADAGGALERITAKGVADRDLSLIIRAKRFFRCCICLMIQASMVAMCSCCRNRY
jgi:hypothetical protein